MSEKNSPGLTLILHWLIALGIFFLFASSWWMLSLPLPSDEYTYRVIPFQLHKNIGITLFFAMVLLAYLGIKHRSTKNEQLSNWHRKLARIDHIILYLLIFACCVSGYLSSSFSGWDTTVWWLVNLPAWGEENDALNILFSDIHLWTCWGLLAVLSVHISAAIFHAFANDGAIARMFRF